MISAYQSALSGLQAFGTRLHSNANNIANISSESFKRTRVLLAETQPQGVRTSVERIDAPGTQFYEETARGYELTELSNVDLGTELPEMNLNTIAYKANLKTIRTADEMFGTLLNLKA